MNPELRFRVEEALKKEDFGEDLGGGFHIQDIGRSTPEPGKAEVAPTQEKRKPKTRAERERIPEQMAVQLMDHFMETLNDQMTMNPIRDGVPQCTDHPFNRNKGLYGCIHACVKQNPEKFKPVVKDATLWEVFLWVKSLINASVRKQELKMGYTGPIQVR